MTALQQFLSEARRRRVFRTAALYVVGAWVLIQVVDQLFQAWAVPDAALRFVWIGLVIGFPLAVVFGWNYDITANGVVRASPADPQSATDLSLRRPDYLILSALALVAGGVIWGVAERARELPLDDQGMKIEAADNSIVVLPFRNLSDESGDDYLSAGLTTELSGNLARIPDLQVTASRSAFAVAGLGLDIREIGERLAVRFVLDGTIRKFQEQLRIDIELIDVQSGLRLWQKNYDREMGDIFVLQSEIASSVLSALQVPLEFAQAQALAPVLTQVPKAYEFYLLGLHEFHQMENREEYGDWVDRSIEYYQQAIEADPAFASAYARLARTHLFFLWTIRSDQYEESMAIARSLIDKALALDPQLDIAYTALARVHRNEGDMAGEITALQKALKLNPANIGALASLGDILWKQGRLSEARVLIRSAASRDPLNSSTILLNANLDAKLGNYDLAKAQLLRMIDEDSDGNGISELSSLEHSYGHYDEAIRWRYQDYQRDPDGVTEKSMMAGVALNLGAPEIAENWLAATDNTNHPSKLSSRMKLLFLSGRADQAATEINAMIGMANLQDDQRLNPAIAYVFKYASFVNSIAGNYDIALAHFKRQEGSQPLSLPIDLNILLYASMARMAQELDRPEEAQRYLDITEAEVRKFEQLGETRYPGYTVARAIWHAARGDEKKTLALVEQSIDQGFRSGDMLRLGVPFKDFQELPEFKALLTRIADDIEVQRDRAIKNGWLVEPPQTEN